ncbi:MAG: hypothetical protein AB4058_17815 [Microcystaceae cyanobacterium]
MIKKFPFYLLSFPLLLLLGGTQAPQRYSSDLDTLSGNLRLTLKHGVWKLWEEKPIYQDMTLDLVCDRGQCQPHIWGHSARYNKEVDHLGEIMAQKVDNLWHLQINLNIQPHPFQTEVSPATYKIQLIPQKDKLIGSYQGKFNGKRLSGGVKSKVTPHWPISVPNHQLLLPQEHPRLAFRKSQLPALREKAQTPVGKAILKQLNESLQQKVYYQAFVPNGGYHGAGHCFLAVLNQDNTAAETGWQLVQNSMQQPEDNLLKQSPIVAGVALAYDMCYDFWTAQRRQQVTKWLEKKTYALIRGGTAKNGWNGNAVSNWNARARGAAALAALAIMDEPSLSATETHLTMESQAMIAQRNLKRYLETAIGDRGFGTEGDFYSTEPWVLSVIPALIAYRNIMGQDLITNAKPEWFLPHYVMRAIPQPDLPISSYGRHRNYLGGSLFAMGLDLVSPEALPSVMWLYEQQLGLEGNQTFGINRQYQPHQAIYALIGYPLNVEPINPGNYYQNVFVDQDTGLYVFRNQWQDKDDIVTSIYAKRKLVGGWSFPDLGSFRIWGLGQEWAKAGISELNWDNENVVVIPQIEPWKRGEVIRFDPHSNGSGVVSLLSHLIRVKDGDSIVTTSWLRSYGVDYSGSSGSSGLFVIVDHFLDDGAAKPFQDKTWLMQTEGEVSIKDNTFLIQGSNGATLKGTFITPELVNISYQKNELGGQIKATGGDSFFVVMSLQKGTIPEVKTNGLGLNSVVKVGQQTIIYQDGQVVFTKLD